MSSGWKEALLAGDPPAGYRRDGAILGREELMDATERVLWSDSRFVARSRTPHTTSAVEARIRRRHLERLVAGGAVDRERPLLDLGCADGTFAHDLLDLGVERLVATDILHSSVATLEASLDDGLRERVLLVVDDMLRLPFPDESFDTVLAWGILSVTGDFDRALEAAWRWVAPGGSLLLAEPLREQALVYALVRGDLGEFRRILTDGTRAEMWDKREERYRVNPLRFYAERLERLPDAEIAEHGGVSMLPSLALGGVAQDAPVEEDERERLSELLADPALDELALWRQAYWLVRKR